MRLLSGSAPQWKSDVSVQLSAVDEAIVAATKQAETFVQVRAGHDDLRSFSSVLMLRSTQQFYAAHDTPVSDRSQKVANFYSPAARITWNGNPVAYGDLPAFLDRMPKSSHDIQVFDCHPIPGESHLHLVWSLTEGC